MQTGETATPWPCATASLVVGSLLKVYPSSARLFTPYLRNHGLAASSARLTFLMFYTPVVSSHSWKACSPCLAKMGIPFKASARVSRSVKVAVNTLAGKEQLHLFNKSV